MENWKQLASEGFYFVGDSAYALKSFLVTPYDNTLHETADDNLNFSHLLSRISVECAFGEIDLRWGILWKPLRFSLKHNVKVIDACMRLHNFIVDFREARRSVFDSAERPVFDDDCRRFLAIHPEVDFGVHGGEQDIRLGADGSRLIGGRPTKDDSNSTDHGKNLRNMLREFITDQRLQRPRTNWYRENNRVME